MKVMITRDVRERLAREHLEQARVLKMDTTEQLLDAVGHLTQAIQYNPLFVNALLMRANVSTRLGRHDAAITDYSVAIQVEDHGLDRRRLSALYVARANVFRKIHKWNECIMDLSRAVEVEPDNGTWLYELGLAYTSQGCTALAQHFFSASLNEKVTARMTDHVRFRALASLGMCKLRVGDINGAICVLSKGIEIQETAPLFNLLGIALFMREEYKEALQKFNRAHELDGMSSEYHINLGVCNFQMKLLPEALKHFEDAVLKGEKRAFNYFFRANAKLMLRMYPQAHMDIDDAITLEPSSESHHYTKVLILVEEENYDAALTELQSTINLNNNFRTAWVHSGLVHYLQNKLFAALKCFTKALELEENDALMHELLGLVYCGLQYHDLALKSFTQCIALQPKNPLFYFRRGAARLEHGDTHGALLDLYLTVNDHNWREPQALHCLSVALRNLGRFEEALEAANAAVAGNAGNYRYLMQRAECFFDLRQYAAAMEDAERMAELGHESAELCYMRGRCCYALRDFDATTTHFLRAAALQPRLDENADYCFALGVAYAHSGMSAAAAAALTNAIERHAAPPIAFFDERAKVRQQLGDAIGVLNDLNVVLAETPTNAMVFLRRSFAHKALQKYEMAAKDFEKAKSLDVPDGVLSVVPYEQLFNIEYVEWKPDPD